MIMIERMLRTTNIKESNTCGERMRRKGTELSAMSMATENIFKTIFLFTKHIHTHHNNKVTGSPALIAPPLLLPPPHHFPRTLNIFLSGFQVYDRAYICITSKRDCTVISTYMTSFYLIFYLYIFLPDSYIYGATKPTALRDLLLCFIFDMHSSMRDLCTN